MKRKSGTLGDGRLTLQEAHVDFRLICVDGKPIENPYHYRDSRTNGMIKKDFELMPKRSKCESTGPKFMQFNTLYHLLAMRFVN